MKKFIYAALVPFAIIFALVSCAEESNSLSPNEQLQSRITNGAWFISFYWDDDKDETGDFAAFDFTFKEDGRFIASGDSTVITGTWSSYTEDSKLRLNIKFFSPQKFEDISDDWIVAEQTDAKLRLEDVSGGSGATDYLTFEKR